MKESYIFPSLLTSPEPKEHGSLFSLDDCFQYAIISDSTVSALYGKPLQDVLTQGGLSSSLFSFPAGEEYKTRETKELLEDSLFEQGFGKDSCFIALGGGVVTDLVGYLAATFCRGVSHILMPTTLLAMCDAAIGGKTGVNVPQGKNLIGCLHFPKKTIIDLSTLHTLPWIEKRNGFAEVIKHALLADSNLFSWLRSLSLSAIMQDPSLLEALVRRNIQIKQSFIYAPHLDARHLDARHLLNFGHTIGHALEKISGYTLSHGEAVAVGLFVESHIALQLGFLSYDTLSQIEQILLQYEFPLKLPPAFSSDVLLEAMILDKKSCRKTPRFSLVAEIGSPLTFQGSYCTSVPEHILKTSLTWIERHAMHFH